MKEKRRFNLIVCFLKFDTHNGSHKPCYGTIELVGTVPLCARHRALVEAIKRDANREKRRHPVHRSRAAA